MKIYKDKKTELEDVKSTGWSFCIVGTVGLIGLILIDLDIIKIDLSGSSKIITSVTMGILFLIFMYVGIKSFLSLKKTEASIDSQFNLEENILTWFRDNCLNEMKMIEYNSDEPAFFFYSEIIREKLEAQYPDLKEEFMEYMIEKLYTEVFPE